MIASFTRTHHPSPILIILFILKIAREHRVEKVKRKKKLRMHSRFFPSTLPSSHYFQFIFFFTPWSFLFPKKRNAFSTTPSPFPCNIVHCRKIEYSSSSLSSLHAYLSTRYAVPRIVENVNDNSWTAVLFCLEQEGCRNWNSLAFIERIEYTRNESRNEARPKKIESLRRYRGSSECSNWMFNPWVPKWHL